MAGHGITCPCRTCCNKFESKGMSWDSDKRRYVKVGARFSIGGGETLTVNPTKDRNVPGGWYQTSSKGKSKKSTAVYDKDGNMPKGRGDNDQYR